MAEFVNQRVEDMLSELEQMKRIGLYNVDEIRTISKKRTDFEYKIHRATKCKMDYVRYIAYESILLQDIKQRRQELSINDKKADIEYTLSKRVRKLFKEVLKRFPGGLELWLAYIIYCKCVNFIPCITAIFEELLQFHGDKARVWQMACRWEYEEMHSVDTARTFAVKGLQRHPTFHELYLDAFRMELKAAENMEEEQRETQLKRAKIFMKSALKHAPVVELIVKLCSIAISFDFAESLQEKLFSELWKNHKDKKEAWEFVAKCELEGKSVGKFDWRSLSEDFFLRKCPENLANFFNVYETAFAMIPHDEACNGYIKSAIKLTAEESENTITKLQVLKRALTKGHTLGQLNEQQYKLWIDMLCCDEETTEDEISKVLEEASVKLPSSEYVWKERLQRNKGNPVNLIKIFKQAEAALPSEKGTMLWIILLENSKDLSKLKKCLQDSMRLAPNISKSLKPVFLKTFYEVGGIGEARDQYADMVKVPPFELNLHKKMMELEGQQKVINYKQLKNCHEITIQQFGKNNPEIWMDFIKFEMNNGHPECCGPLYTRACSSLHRECVDKFIVMYSLNNK